MKGSAVTRPLSKVKSANAREHPWGASNCTEKETTGLLPPQPQETTLPGHDRLKSRDSATTKRDNYGSRLQARWSHLIPVLHSPRSAGARKRALCRCATCCAARLAAKDCAQRRPSST